MIYITIIVVLLALALAFRFAPKGWRTIVANAVVLLFVPLVEIVPAVQAALPDTWSVWAIAGVNVMNMWLRKITTTAIGKSV